MVEGALAQTYDLPDDELVARVCGGDDRAAEFLLCERLGSTVAYLAERFDYDDLLGDLYVHLREHDWTRLRQWGGVGSLTGWLRQVCVRLCYTRHRARRRAPLIPFDVPLHETADPSNPYDDLVASRERETLLGEIESLPHPRDRLLLMKYLFDGSDANQLAAEFGVSKEHVYVLKARATARLKKRFGHGG